MHIYLNTDSHKHTHSHKHVYTHSHKHTKINVKQSNVSLLYPEHFRVCSHTACLSGNLPWTLQWSLYLTVRFGRPEPAFNKYSFSAVT